MSEPQCLTGGYNMYCYDEVYDLNVFARIW